MDGLFIKLTAAEQRTVMDRVAAAGFSPDSDGVRAFLLSTKIPPRPPTRDPLLHLALHTIDRLANR